MKAKWGGKKSNWGKSLGFGVRQTQIHISALPLTNLEDLN